MALPTVNERSGAPNVTSGGGGNLISDIKGSLLEIANDIRLDKNRRSFEEKQGLFEIDDELKKVNKNLVEHIGKGLSAAFQEQNVILRSIEKSLAGPSDVERFRTQTAKRREARALPAPEGQAQARPNFTGAAGGQQQLLEGPKPKQGGFFNFVKKNATKIATGIAGGSALAFAFGTEYFSEIPEIRSRLQKDLDAGKISKEKFDERSANLDKQESGAMGGMIGGGGGALAGAAAGAALGSVVPVVGTAIGAIIGGFLGGTGGALAGEALGEEEREFGLFGETKVAKEANEKKYAARIKVPFKRPVQKILGMKLPLEEYFIDPQATPKGTYFGYPKRNSKSGVIFKTAAVLTYIEKKLADPNGLTEEEQKANVDAEIGAMGKAGPVKPKPTGLADAVKSVKSFFGFGKPDPLPKTPGDVAGIDMADDAGGGSVIATGEAGVPMGVDVGPGQGSGSGGAAPQSGDLVSTTKSDTVSGSFKSTVSVEKSKQEIAKLVEQFKTAKGNNRRIIGGKLGLYLENLYQRGEITKKQYVASLGSTSLKAQVAAAYTEGGPAGIDKFIQEQEERRLAREAEMTPEQRAKRDEMMANFNFGGPIQKGQTGLVGEGPDGIPNTDDDRAELFTAPETGKIVPNNQLPSAEEARSDPMAFAARHKKFESDKLLEKFGTLENLEFDTTGRSGYDQLQDGQGLRADSIFQSSPTLATFSMLGATRALNDIIDYENKIRNAKFFKSLGLPEDLVGQSTPAIFAGPETSDKIKSTLAPSNKADFLEYAKRRTFARRSLPPDPKYFGMHNYINDPKDMGFGFSLSKDDLDKSLGMFAGEKSDQHKFSEELGEDIMPKRYQFGGVIQKGETGIVGDAGAEAFVPSGRSRINAAIEEFQRRDKETGGFAIAPTNNDNRVVNNTNTKVVKNILPKNNNESLNRVGGSNYGYM